MQNRMDMVQKQVETAIPFVARAGLKVLELQPGYVKLLMPFKGNENHVGTMYAGAIFTLAEIPGGALVYTTFDPQRYYPVAKEITIRYRRPVKTDATIEVRLSPEEIKRLQGEADREGKAEFVIEADILDTTGEVVAMSRGIYQVRAVGM
ncbi:thioesterase domain-containing protein, putative [Desulfacinum infernum DSM 9756]|uniref:Thioesterase domain-containing protein, putative n=1 Tax=Desulfacinum infernum DSM 9756 TaxID=1121391 RepID=A0A1M5GG63_9BACT|nr:YiiD C-terminal domain-containing protein [Desulfacinum infernum]SHG02714.1 thioesterase domain-containing protein, putative [Desulfacinum infernum DSM 9756]